MPENVNAPEVGQDALQSLAYGTATTAAVVIPQRGTSTPEYPEPDTANAIDFGGTVKAQVITYGFRAETKDGKLKLAPYGAVVKVSKETVEKFVRLKILRAL